MLKKEEDLLSMVEGVDADPDGVQPSSHHP